MVENLKYHEINYRGKTFYRITSNNNKPIIIKSCKIIFTIWFRFYI